MKYATLCAGIGGFDKGWDNAGMEPVYQCEIDAKCQSVLSRHWPQVAKGWDVSDDQTERDIVRLRPDAIGFGSPCQDLSVAGRRGGLAAERSGLFFRCMELCFACQAPWVVWENVPGVFSSNRGEDFASVIEAFTGVRPEVPRNGWRNTGVCVGPLYSIAWAVLDSQWFGVPQRRRRVFVVGCLADRGSPYEILSLPESLPWDSPPSREAGKRTSRSVAACLNSGGNDAGFRIEPGEHLVPTLVSNGDAHSGFRDACGLVAHTLKAEGHDASEDGTGRGVPLVTAALRGNYHCDQDGDETKLVAYGGNNTKGPIDVATACNASASASGRQDFESETFVMQQKGEIDANAEKAYARTLLRELRHQAGEEAFAVWCAGVIAALHTAKVLQPSLHVGGVRREGQASGGLVNRSSSREKDRAEGAVRNLWEAGCEGCPPQGWQPSEQLSRELTAYLSKLSQPGSPTSGFLLAVWEASEGIGVLRQALSAVQKVGRPKDGEAQSKYRDSDSGRLTGYGVRRLTPREAERLQGFPDNWTLYGADGEQMSDSARYRMLGNAVTVDVAEWIGRRIIEAT